MPPPHAGEPGTLLTQAEAALDRRVLPQALAAFHQAEALGADLNRCRAGRWLASMLAGDLPAAWNESDRIRQSGAPDPHRFWNGEDLRNHRVIVRSLHGLGDAVQMLRYAPRLRALAAHVVYEVNPRLLPLAPCFPAVDNIITWGEQAPPQPPAWDIQLEIMELPFLFRTTLEELPIATRYLHLPESILTRTARALGPRTKPRVGLVWTSGEWNPTRSLSPVLLESLLHPLLANPHLDLWSLEHTPTPARRPSPPNLRNATQVCGDGLLPLAATIAHLDLVLTVDTLAAHLAGALGTPAWLLLQHAADWRWLHARSDSPWYPTLRLFRQPTPGDWPSVLHRVQQELTLLA